MPVALPALVGNHCRVALNLSPRVPSAYRPRMLCSCAYPHRRRCSPNRIRMRVLGTQCRKSRSAMSADRLLHDSRTHSSGHKYSVDEIQVWRCPHPVCTNSVQSARTRGDMPPFNPEPARQREQQGRFRQRICCRQERLARSSRLNNGRFHMGASQPLRKGGIVPASGAWTEC